MAIEFFVTGWGIGFTVYIVVQFLAVAVMHGRGRRLAMLPIPVMGGVLLWTIHAYGTGSNLWPIVMIFASPIAIISLVMLWVVFWIAQKREVAARDIHPTC